MTLRDTMLHDADQIAGDTTEFGEALIVHPKNGDPDVPVFGVVDRIGVVRDDNGVAFEVATIVIPNGGTNGTTALTTGDQITVAMVEGGPTAKARVREIISQDPGAWHVEVVGGRPP